MSGRANRKANILEEVKPTCSKESINREFKEELEDDRSHKGIRTDKEKGISNQKGMMTTHPRR
jgi:hypothetical protein